MISILKINCNMILQVLLFFVCFKLFVVQLGVDSGGVHGVQSPLPYINIVDDPTKSAYQLNDDQQKHTS